MLTNLFTSKTRIKILNLLFNNQSYHLREISRRIKISPIYTSKELKNLTNINLVTKTKLANLTLYQINSKNKILPELKQIFKKCK